MTIELTPEQRWSLATRLRYLDTDEQRTVLTLSEHPGGSTQITVNGQWLYRDGTWHDKPEPPSPRFLVRRDDPGIPYFKEYINGGIQWTERPEDAAWWPTKNDAQEFIDTDVGLRKDCAVWEHHG